MSEAATGLRFTAEAAHSPSGESVAVLVFEGDLDLATVAEFQQAAGEADGRLVVLDLSDVRFIDSSGIHAVVRARLERAATDGELEIVVARGSAVERVLSMSGLGEELPPHFDRAGALGALGEDGPRA
jgi:anti-anti-sigma factor